MAFSGNNWVFNYFVKIFEINFSNQEICQSKLNIILNICDLAHKLERNAQEKYKQPYTEKDKAR